MGIKRKVRCQKKSCSASGRIFSWVCLWLQPGLMAADITYNERCKIGIWVSTVKLALGLCHSRTASLE